MKKTIHFDMDGVIVDFVQGYKDAFDRDAYKDDPFTINQLCLQIPHFFRMLPVNEKGLELFELLKDNYNIVFLTTPMKEMDTCKRDKVLWVQENLGNYDVLFSDSKADYVVDSESILIDDMDYNLSPWIDAGGTAIKFPAKIESITEQIEEAFDPNTKKIKKQLKDMKVAPDPSEKQKEKGNYSKGHIIFKGIPLVIENEPGSFRSGIGENGKKWFSRIKNYYGYIPKTEGADGDEIDVFLGDKLNASRVFVVNQLKDDNMFDEIKIIFGVETEEEAKALYLQNYKKGWESHIQSIIQTNTKKLREWLISGSKFEPFK